MCLDDYTYTEKVNMEKISVFHYICNQKLNYAHNKITKDTTFHPAQH